MTAPERLSLIAVVGARPNFMKIAPLLRAIDAWNARVQPGTPHIACRLVHTGQHYDHEMSNAFFAALDIPEPDLDLGIGSGSHAEQVGRTMIAFEQVLRERPADWVVVVGDVNATCACAITARKLHHRLAHIEAGLRSFDMRMPEEINRLVTDRLANLLFTTDAMADANLLREGMPAAAIHRVGNIMVDTLEQHRPHAEALDLEAILTRHAVEGRPPATALRPQKFAVLTLHRPANVDSRPAFTALVRTLTEIVAPHLPLVWVLHPRTRQRLHEFDLYHTVWNTPGIHVLNPVGYREMLRLNMACRLMLTDSGGLQEECCIFGTPCITLRDTTERPMTLLEHGGVSVLTGNDPDRIQQALRHHGQRDKAPHRPDGWDGHTAERIVTILAQTGTEHDRQHMDQKN